VRIDEVTDATEDAWRDIHNRIIPAHPLSAEDVRERRQRNLLTLAFQDEELVGNATLRPPADNSDTATVIVRILPEQRNQGFGASYLAAMLERVRVLGVARVQTVVLTDNAAGLRFAHQHGFVEIDRYVVDGAEYVDLGLIPA